MPKKSLSEQGIIHLFSQQRKIYHLLNITHIMGSTFPRNVISPVIAKFFFTLR